ncbi:MAG: hypothetical protein ACLFWL_16480 [Candidatus Brocadiia bacterium]
MSGLKSKTKSRRYEAYPLGEAMIITGTTVLKNDDSQSYRPERLAAIFKNGRIQNGEYRISIADRTTIVRVSLQDEENK